MGNGAPSEGNYREESSKYQDLIPIIESHDALVHEYYESMRLFEGLNPAIVGVDTLHKFQKIFFEEKEKKQSSFDLESVDRSSFTDDVCDVLGSRNPDIYSAMPDLKSVIRNRSSLDDRQYEDYTKREMAFIRSMPFWARYSKLKKLEEENGKRNTSKKEVREKVAVFLRQKQEGVRVVGEKVAQVHILLKRTHKLQEILAPLSDFTDRQKMLARSALVHLRSALHDSNKSSKEAFDGAYERVERSLNFEKILKHIQTEIEKIEVEMEEKVISRRTKLRGVLILIQSMGGSQEGIAETAQRYREMEGEIQKEYERVKEKLMQLKDVISSGGQSPDAYQENVEGVAEYVSSGGASFAILQEFNRLIAELDKLTEELESHMNIPKKRLGGPADVLALSHEEDAEDSDDEIQEMCRGMIKNRYHVTPDEMSKIDVLFSRAAYEDAVAVAKEFDPNVKILPRKEVLSGIISLGEDMLKEIAKFGKPTLLVVPRTTFEQKEEAMNAHKKYENQVDGFVSTDKGSPFLVIATPAKVSISIVDGAPHMPHIPTILPNSRFDQRKLKFKKHYQERGMCLINVHEYVVLMQRSLYEYKKSGNDEVSRDTSKILDFTRHDNNTYTCLDDQYLGASPRVAFGCFGSLNRQMFFYASGAEQTFADLRGRPSMKVMEY
ncbi:MAG: hypothetical protein NTX63_00580 [Candidatus Peregrinibacteria bacterium]|nr:hypothetical protein [Candidatus Peregrinibacteria bacterium]